MSADGRWTMLVAELEREPSDHAAKVALRAEVEQALAPFRARVDELHATSFAFVEAEVCEELGRDARRFLVGLPLLLAAVMLAPFRSGTVLACVRPLRLALVTVLANVPPLAAVVALHGWGGVPLNSVTVMAGAVVLGIAVDHGIHLVSFWTAERGRFADGGLALRWVLFHELPPILVTTAVLAAGFGLLLLSGFPPVRDFGRLAVLALGTALAATATLLFALLPERAPGALRAASVLGISA